VKYYEILADSIVVYFDDAVYEYSRASVGTPTLDEMKRLAELGSGLHAFINSISINHAFSRKL